MKKHSILVLFISLLTIVAAPASAQSEHIIGHMKPFDSEMLTSPMKLNCGVTVYEWRGGDIDRPKLESLCLLATSSFNDYLARRGLRKGHSKPFEWSMSLSPWGSCYRCINDLNWRFRGRTARFWVTGYTSFHFDYTFLMGDTNHPNFDVTVVHELWHAMSWYYGIYDQHPGTREQRARADEQLAMGFTEWLGLGR